MRKYSKGLLLMGALLSSSTAQADELLLTKPWWLFEGEHFEVATNLPQRGSDFVLQLERFRAVVLAFTGLAAVPDRLPTRAIIFADSAELARITGSPTILGYTSTTLRNNRMVSSGGRIDVPRRHVMFHEYVHYLLRSADTENNPSWYEEGFAEMLSTVFVEREQEQEWVRIGAPPRPNVRLMERYDRPLPITRFLHKDHPLDIRSQSVGIYYAASWALVHYIHADERRRLRLDEYLGRLRAGEERATAFREAFGTSGRRMMERATKAVRRGVNYIHSYPLEQFPVRGALRQRRLSVNEVARELAYLSVFTNTEFSRRVAESRLALEPDDPTFLTALAVTYQADQAYPRGAELARRAAAIGRRRGSSDVVLEIDLGDLLMIWNRDACAPHADEAPRAAKDVRGVAASAPEDCRKRNLEARSAYRRALMLEPHNPEAHSGMAWALLRLDEDLDAASGHIARALDHQPWSPVLHYRAGVIAKRRGQLKRAAEHLEKARYWSDDQDLGRDVAVALEGLAAAD